MFDFLSWELMTVQYISDYELLLSYNNFLIKLMVLHLIYYQFSYFTKTDLIFEVVTEGFKSLVSAITTWAMGLGFIILVSN